MDLWTKVLGYVQLRFIGVDGERFLAAVLKQGITLWDVRREDELTLSFCAPVGDLTSLNIIASKQGGSLRVEMQRGLRFCLQTCRKRLGLLMLLLLLTIMTIFLPERILFIQVAGNRHVPERSILEAAESCGLTFFCQRRAIRSEQIKNHLLGSIEELQWVGVNTSGSVATIHVRERQTEPENPQPLPGDLIAAVDGVVESVVLEKGEAKVVAGQAVQAGQMLVSGWLDLGICQRLIAAEAEVVARTRRGCAAVLTDSVGMVSENQQPIRKYSILIGKKRINLYSDSGIFMGTCGKMSKVTELHLPGGFALPVSIIVETYQPRQIQMIRREQSDVQQQLYDAAFRQLKQQMIAGTVVTERYFVAEKDDLWLLEASFECREMIARRNEGVYLQNYG